MTERKKILRIHLKAKYWHAIQSGEKPMEYRMANDYWERRLRGPEYDEVHLLLGYPKRGDESKLLRRRWAGYPQLIRLLHPEFGSNPVLVYAVDVTQRLPELA